MPIMRNPFRKQDENARPTSGIVEKTSNNAAAPPKSIDLAEKQAAEYKLSGKQQTHVSTARILTMRG